MIIEETLRDYLNDNDLSVPAYVQRPEVEPESYVIVEKTGSQRMNRIDTATIAIQSYAKTLYEAATLNEEVKALMDEMADHCDDIGSAKLVSDYNFTSTTAKRYRYQAVFSITHY